MSQAAQNDDGNSPRLRMQEVNEEELRRDRENDWSHFGEKFGTARPVYFDLPRKTCAQIVPELRRLFDEIPKPKKHSVDDDVSSIASNDVPEVRLPPKVQHRLHILKRMMKRARINDVDGKMDRIKDLDKAERTVPFGQKSKNIYEDIFIRRDFDLYGRFIDYRISQPPRRHDELAYWGAKKGVEYTQIRDMTLVDDSTISVTVQKLEEERDKEREEADRKRDHAILTAKPLITTEKWKLERMQLHKAPVGFAQNPSQPVHSLGNEMFFSYDGDWRLGRMHGMGLYKFNDGFSYEGMWKANKQHGKGTAYYPGGQVYEGSWEKGRYCGKGESTYVCGSNYKGEHEFGRRAGVGKVSFKSGMMYEGEFRDGRPHGRGVMSSKLTGWSYDGSFNRGFIQGSGTLISPTGKRILQSWPESDFDDGTELQLPTLVSRYVADVDELQRFNDAQRAETLGILRGNQLQAYVSGIRTRMYSERNIIKKIKFNEAMAKVKDAKEKLRQSRLKALTGEDDEPPAVIENGFEKSTKPSVQSTV